MIDRPEPRSAPGLTPRHDDGRLIATSAERNTGPIVEALSPLLDQRRGRALEVGSGTGQHITAFASAFPSMTWQPTDPFDSHLESIRAWIAYAELENLEQPVQLDASGAWPTFGPLQAVFSANVIHITPWTVAQGIFAGAGANLASGGLLLFYGPFKEDGRHTGEGNELFDKRLREQDPAWGIRDIDDLVSCTARLEFDLPTIMHMPANNRLVCFRRS